MRKKHITIAVVAALALVAGTVAAANQTDRIGGSDVTVETGTDGSEFHHPSTETRDTSSAVELTRQADPDVELEIAEPESGTTASLELATADRTDGADFGLERHSGADATIAVTKPDSGAAPLGATTGSDGVLPVTASSEAGTLTFERADTVRQLEVGDDAYRVEVTDSELERVPDAEFSEAESLEIDLDRSETGDRVANAKHDPRISLKQAFDDENASDVLVTADADDEVTRVAITDG